MTDKQEAEKRRSQTGGAPEPPSEGPTEARPLRIAPSVAWQIIDGEAAVLDLSGQRTIGLNQTASLVWSMLADHDESAIVDAITERFEIDPETARADVRQLLATLREQGLVVEA